MDSDFWNAAWNESQTPWRQEHANPALTKYWPTLQTRPRDAVFVPLCGDSIDMKWLIDQGHDVLGVELSRLAAESFFRGQGMTYEHQREGAFDVFRGENIAIYCGDFFELDATTLANISAVYDRGATVALPEPLRTRYARAMGELLPSDTKVLLVGIEYDSPSDESPPFSIKPAAVQQMFSNRFDVHLLERESISEPPPPLVERGFRDVRNVVYELHRHRD